MKPIRRVRGLGVAAAVTATSLILLTATAAQAVVPTWKTTGYVPTCALSVPAGDDAGGPIFQYFDRAAPQIVSLKAAPLVRVSKASGAPFVDLATIRAKDACSGLSIIVGYLARNGHLYASGGAPVTPSNGNYFDNAVKVRLALTTTDVGRYTYPSVLAVDRYDSFYLSGNSKTLLAATPRGGGDITGYAASSAYKNTVTWVLRNTTMNALANHLTVSKTGRVAVSGSLKVSNGTAYVGVGSTRVYLQRQYPGKAWTNVADGLTSASGYVALSNVPGKSASYRLVYKGKYAAPWNAPRTTAAVKVTVK